MKALTNYRREIFCFLLCVVVFCSAWMRATEDNVHKKNYKEFSILQLERPLIDSVTVLATIQKIHEYQVESDVKNNLRIDYFFMAGIYPLIAMWLLMIRKRTVQAMNIGLIILAIAQLIPLVADVLENCYLLHMIDDKPQPFSFPLYTTLVTLKWWIAAGGAAIALLTCIFKPFLVKKEKI